MDDVAGGGGDCIVVVFSVVVVVVASLGELPQPAAKRALPSIAPMVKSLAVDVVPVIMSLQLPECF
jgi:hypothetical protein